jgi:uncharacterized membrane protein
MSSTRGTEGSVVDGDDADAALADLNAAEDSGHSNSSGGHPAYRIRGLYLAVLAVVVTNYLLGSGHRIPFVGAALGWWLILVFPAYLICTTRIWKHISGAERVVLSVGAVLFGLIVGGLAIDVVLPHLGVPRPLALRPVLISVDVMDVALMVWRIHIGAVEGRMMAGLRAMSPREWRVLTFSVICAPVVIAGANRLNNGSGDAVSMVGYAGIAATFAVLLWWRQEIRDAVVSATVYLLSLSLLLGTSLRGWYVTGHDIQQEYLVFQLTKDHGVWNIGLFRTAYNACLSITILPTEIWQLVRVDDPYVFKVFFQLLFAMCPVLVYLLARRHWNKQIAILSVVYFAGFPGFFGDMPFLNRQEIGFLFLGLALLAASTRRWTVRRRRTVMVVWALAIGLSHYSTMYVFVGTLGVAWGAERAGTVLSWLRNWRAARLASTPESATTPGLATLFRFSWGRNTKTLTLAIVIAAGAIAVGWSGGVTRTGSSVVTTAESALPVIFHKSGGGHSVDSSYGLFSGGGPSNAQLLAQYQKQTLHDRKVDFPGTYIPLAKATATPARALGTPSLPVTKLGRLFADVHLPPSLINSVVRGLASKGEQVFIGIGLLLLIFVRQRRRQVGKDIVCLAIGSIVMVAAVTVLPGLSVSYGVLRTFEQGLIVLAPFLVVGSLAIFKFLGRIWSARAASILAIVFFVSTIGVMPQLLGGYPAQLNLNNSGVYYNDYYTHPQEAQAIQWLGARSETEPTGVQAENYTDRYYFSSPHGLDPNQTITDVYPTLVRKPTWVVLGFSTAQTGIATAAISGDLIDYRYPMSVLNQNKDLVFNNGGTVIYK